MDLSLILGIVVGIVLLWALILVLLLLFRPKGVPLRELIRVVPDVMRLLRSIIGDRSTPLDVRAVLVLLLVWIISPGRRVDRHPTIDEAPTLRTRLGSTSGAFAMSIALQ